MQIRFSPNQNDYTKLCTDGLRSNFLVETLFVPGQVELVYSDADRAIIGSAVPTDSALKLSADAELRAAFFCDLRELGLLNIGGSGTVEVDGKYEMNKLPTASTSAVAARKFRSPAKTQRTPRLFIS